MVLVAGSVERTLLGLNLGIVGAGVVFTARAVLALDARRRPLLDDRWAF